MDAHLETRRAALRDQAQTLAAEIAAYRRRVHPSLDSLFQLAANFTADVTQVFLRNSEHTDSPEWRLRWLDLGETQLAEARRSFEYHRSQVEKFGGPEHARGF